MYKLYIVGISGDFLTREQNDLVSSSSLVVGTARFKSLLQNGHIPFQLISPLSGALKSIKNALLEGNVCVFASGDPLFFGIGKLLLKNFPKDSIEILPSLSALQRACALFKLPWDDAKIISLHGREVFHVPGILLRYHKTIIFTDSHNSPDKLAQKIIQYLALIGDVKLLDEIQVHVAEDLGLETQRLVSDKISTIAQQKFSSLNIVCIELPVKSGLPSYTLGLHESDIHHSRGLITKNEVRAATLHQLQLPESGIFWDIGAGSGSISIEAARSNPALTIYAIEHKEEEIQNIKNNIIKFGCYNIIPVFGAAPKSLEQLPTPDRVFVGGSGGSLQSIISHVEKLWSGGSERIVINGVIEKTITEAPRFLTDHGFQINKSIVSIVRQDHNGKSVKFNPITIITGTK